MCQSSFFGIYSVIAVENENNSANTVNATNTENEIQKAYMANGGKIGNFTIFKKGEKKERSYDTAGASSEPPKLISFASGNPTRSRPKTSFNKIS